MLVFLHVIIALGSVVFTTYLFFYPTRYKFFAAYGLVAATLASGTYLVVSTHARLLQACTSGLIYLAVVSTGIALARHKFVADKIDS